MNEPSAGHGASREPAAAHDPAALRRRVLLAGAVALASFFVLGYVLTAVGAPPWLLLPSLLVVAALVLRPIMAPVVEANRERRRQAYAAFRAQRAAEQADPDKPGQGGR